MIDKKLILGTRGSLLALAQTQIVIKKLATFFPEIQIETKIIKTLGDKLKNHPLKDIGGKTVFTKELEESLLNYEIDMAVHSMKDLEMPIPQNLIIACFLKREDVRDAFISSSNKKLQDLPFGSTIGTCSPRRIAQILAFRPDLKTVIMRGNVDTRLRKLSGGECDAIILACAGLNRLQMSHTITEILSLDIMIPAIAQGSIGVEIRKEDQLLRKALRFINDKETENLVHVEYHLLRGFEGNCETPIAGWAEYSPNQASKMIKLNAMVALLDGKKIMKKTLIEKEDKISDKAFTLGQEFKLWYTQHLIF